jgi:hypothetical protein
VNAFLEWLLRVFAAVATLALAVWVHELGHRKHAWRYDKGARIVWGWPHWETVYDGRRMSTRQEQWVLLAGILYGLIPLGLFGLFSFWTGVWVQLATLTCYLWACKYDIHRLMELDERPGAIGRAEET